MAEEMPRMIYSPDVAQMHVFLKNIDIASSVSVTFFFSVSEYFAKKICAVIDGLFDLYVSK